MTMNSTDATTVPGLEDDAELNMIRSMLDAEQSNCDTKKREAHDAIIKRLGSSSSSITATEIDESSTTSNAAKTIVHNEEGTTSSPTKSARGESASVRSTSNTLASAPVGPKRVANLLRHKRQRNPLLLDGATTVAAAAKQLASTRNSAFLVVAMINGKQQLTGIGTDSDISKSVGRGVDPSTTQVKDIMTPYPKSVGPDDDAQIAFRLMVRNRFRHLPVVKRTGEICGLLDITQCLFDGISQLEQHQVAARSFVEAVQKTRLRWSMDQETNQHSTVAKGMIDQMMSSFAPSVGGLVSAQSRTSECFADATICDAAQTMATKKKTAILVFAKDPLAPTSSSDGQPPLVVPPSDAATFDKLVGILTTKDVLRAVARGVDTGSVQVSEVMTPDPDTVPSSCSLLDALHTMHDGKYLHVPVEGDDGKVCGVLDVLDCAVATFGPSLKSKNDVGTQQQAEEQHSPEFSDLLFHSQPNVSGNSVADRRDSVSDFGAPDTASVAAVSVARSVQQPMMPSAPQPEMCLKIRVPNSKMVKRVHCEFEYNSMIKAVRDEVVPDGGEFTAVYIDEDGDEVALLSPTAFQTAVTLYNQLKWTKLDVIVRTPLDVVLDDVPQEPAGLLSSPDIALVIGGAALVLSAAILLFWGRDSGTQSYPRRNNLHRR